MIKDNADKNNENSSDTNVGESNSSIKTKKNNKNDNVKDAQELEKKMRIYFCDTFFHKYYWMRFRIKFISIINKFIISFFIPMYIYSF